MKTSYKLSMLTAAFARSVLPNAGAVPGMDKVPPDTPFRNTRLPLLVILFAFSAWANQLYAQHAITGVTVGSAETANPAASSYDNNESTRWCSFYAYQDAWIQYDLGSSKSVDKVQLLLYLRASRTYAMKIEVDGVQVWSGNTTLGSGYWEVTFTAKTGRYVKISNTGPNSNGSGFLSIYESKIFGSTDTTNPTVSVASPSSGTTLTGTVNVTAAASDNVGVVGVQFKLDGSNLGAEDTSAPYSIDWDATTASNGSHTLTAVARDAAGNTTTSSGVSVTVDNSLQSVTLSPTGDTYLNVNTSNFTASTQLNTYTWPVNKIANAIILKFDISSLPEGAEIETATLRLYQIDGQKEAGGYDLTAHKIINVNPVISGATGYTYDGTNAWTAQTGFDPPLAQGDIASAEDTQSLDLANGYKSWTITNMVQDWLDTPTSNRGVLINSDPTAAVDAYRYFGSMEALNSNQRPMLEIIYSDPDTEAPTVSITAPAASATVSGTVNVTANASDNVEVAGVQFKLDGVNLGAEDTSSPFSISWDATTATAGSHTLTAVARDAAGNTTTSSGVTVTVDNSVQNVALSPTGDTYLNVNTTNYTSDTQLNTYTWPVNKIANAIILKFDLSELPEGAEIETATLKLYQIDGQKESGGYDVTAHKIINVNPVISGATGYTYDGTNAWTAYTGFNPPLAQGDIATAEDTQSLDLNNGYKAWTITNMVQDWLDTPTSNRGVLLNSDPTAAVDAYRFFGSLEASNSNQRPKLEITYTVQQDTVPPTVSITAPAASATVSGTVNVSASASDDVGVAGVQFKLDGSNLGSEDTTSPYSISWDATTTTNGSHTLTAVARDAAGHTTTSSGVTVTVSNSTVPVTNECANPGPGWIWCDDFESNKISSYFQHSLSRTSAVGLNGSYGLAATFQPSVEEAGNLKLAFGRTPSGITSATATTQDFREIYWRQYVRVPSNWQGGHAYKLNRAMILANSSWAQAMIAHIWGSGSDDGSGSGAEKIKMDPARGTNSSGTLVTTGYNDFNNLTWLGAVEGPTEIFDSENFGEWHCVEAHVKLNDSGQSNGVFEFWIDDDLQASRTNLNWVGSYSAYGINAIFWENYWNGGQSQVQQTRYHDNFVVSTNRVGCGSAPVGEAPSSPGSPQFQVVANDANGVDILATWTAPTGGGELDHYYYRAGEAASDPFVSTQTTSLQVLLEDLDHDTEFWFCVRGVNAAGESEDNCDSFTTPSFGGGGGGTCADPGSGWLFCNDFEGSNPSGFAMSGDATVVTEQKHSGSKSMRVTFEDNEDQAGGLFSLSDQNHVFVRYYDYYASDFDFACGMKVARIRSFDESAQINYFDIINASFGAGSSSGARNFCGVNNHKDLAMVYNGGPNDWGMVATSAPISRGQWYCTELEVKLNTPGQSNGEIRIWLDSDLEAERTGINIRGSLTAGVDRVLFGGWYSNGCSGQNPCLDPQTPARRYLDDLVVSTQRIGCESGGGGGSGARMKTRGDAETTTEADLPDGFGLENYPNPFTQSTQISYTLPEPSQARVEVYDAMGRKVATLVDGRQPAGTHLVKFDGATQPGGIYTYVLEAGNRRITKKMLLIK